MAINNIQLKTALQKPYDRLIFGAEVLTPVFGSALELIPAQKAGKELSKAESIVIESVLIYGKISFEDGSEVTLYEIKLQPDKKIEFNKVAIQRYVRKLLTSGQAALVNFIAPENNKVWRLTLISKDSELTEEGIKEKTTHAKRYTYLLGPAETCKTPADRLEALSILKEKNINSIVEAFRVDLMSEAFFDEYTLHYNRFCHYFQESSFRKSVFKISTKPEANQDEIDKASKPIRDFVKKLLGRVVFLYFVQKKGWLGASDTNYQDGLPDFIKQLFNQSGGNETFYSVWLKQLFFEALNRERKEQDFTMPDGTKLKVPFLNGGLFDKEEFDDATLTIEGKLFHNVGFEETALTEKNKDNARGFLDFLDAYNFTVHEDSPDDHTVAVDPEMLGHIFENLLEDNKDKGAFYTPKEIVHYMCQESLTEYLATQLEIKDESIQNDLSHFVRTKDVSETIKPILKNINEKLDAVKICDPAIGSGAFPMGLLQEMHALKEVIAFELNLDWKPADVKENIIQNSIYGVDIEKGAVDIARLRFWLSLIVDVEKPRALPNLDYKIVKGNSLVSKFENEIIEIEWDRKKYTTSDEKLVKNIQALLEEIAVSQRNFFDPKTKNKAEVKAEIRDKKLELLINQLTLNKLGFENRTPILGGFAPTAKETKQNTERQLQIAGFDNSIQKLKHLRKNGNVNFDHFDWKLDFPEILNPYITNLNAGFDIVIANPPYLKERDNAHIFHEVNNSIFGHSWHQGKMDYWFYFLHKAIDIGKTQKSVIAFITSRYWLNSQGAKKLIDRISKCLTFTNVVDIGKLKVFDNVAGHHMIHIYSREKIDDFVYKKLQNNIKSISRETENNDLKIRRLKNADVFKDSKEIIFSDDTLDTSVETLELGNIYDVSQGVVEAADKISSKQFKQSPNSKFKIGQGVFVLNQTELRQIKPNKNEEQLIKKYLDPNDVKKYSIYKNELKFIIYADKHGKQKIEQDSEFINLKRHLDSLQEYITSSNKPYGLHRSRQTAYFERPKIIFKGMFVEPEFTIDYDKHYFGMSFSSIIQKEQDFELEYLLAILNSKFARTWYYTNGKLRGAGVDIGVEKLRTFPIPVCSNQNSFGKIVKYIIFIKSQTLEDITTHLIASFFEQIIEGMVYELYFPDLIKKHKREIIQHLGELPELKDEMSDAEKIRVCKEVFARLNDSNHPVKQNLEFMKEIPEIKLIEGVN